MIVRGSGSHPLNRKYYYLEFTLPGYAEPLRFEIDPADGERLKEVLQLPADELDFYFSFTSKDEQHVTVSVQDIQLVNFLWQSAAYNVRKRWRIPRLKICFKGQARPYEALLGDASWLQPTFKTETFGEKNEPFLFFLNVDGDEIHFRSEQAYLLAYGWDERVNMTAIATREGTPHFKLELTGVFGGHVWQKASEADLTRDEKWYGHLDFVIDDENASYDYEFESYGPYPTKSAAVEVVQEDFEWIVGVITRQSET